MKVYHGLKELLSAFDDIPDSDWISVLEDFSTKESVEKISYYIAESEEEQFDLEDNYDDFLEAPTFKDIVINKRNHHPHASLGDIANAIIYYLEKDDFED